jgi:hypothetical protein
MERMRLTYKLALLSNTVIPDSLARANREPKITPPAIAVKVRVRVYCIPFQR